MLLACTRYGLIACRYLTEGYYGNRYIPAPEIAEKYNMNIRALMPALRQLTRAGILRSRVGGTEPGFIFSRDPETISMLEILSALEGNLKITCCREIIKGLKCDCHSKEHCVILSLLGNLFDQGKSNLSRLSIKDHALKAKENELSKDIDSGSSQSDYQYKK